MFSPAPISISVSAIKELSEKREKKRINRYLVDPRSLRRFKELCGFLDLEVLPGNHVWERQLREIKENKHVLLDCHFCTINHFITINYSWEPWIQWMRQNAGAAIFQEEEMGYLQKKKYICSFGFHAQNVFILC